MNNGWVDLNWWHSKEWTSVVNKLNAVERDGGTINPRRSDTFLALERCDPSSVRCCIVGQDPYPTSTYATGVAFSIPRGIEKRDFPPTLRELYREYSRDLRLEIPSHGDLSGWVSQGVLLWNAVPVVQAGLPLSCDWNEFISLNQEVFSRLSERGIVFAFLGAVARRYASIPNPENNRIIETSHPSPRGSLNSRKPFRGSRLFSTINQNLLEIGLEPIDWKIDETPGQKGIPRPSLDGGNVLRNITGVDLGGLKGRDKPSYYSSEFTV